MPFLTSHTVCKVSPAHIRNRSRERKLLCKEIIMTNFSTVVSTTCCVQAKIENPPLLNVHGCSEWGMNQSEDLKRCAFTRLHPWAFKGAESENKEWLRSLTMGVGCYLVPQEKMWIWKNSFLSFVFRSIISTTTWNKRKTHRRKQDDCGGDEKTF